MGKNKQKRVFFSKNYSAAADSGQSTSSSFLAGFALDKRIRNIQGLCLK